jgi:chromosome segregation ATPase
MTIAPPHPPVDAPCDSDGATCNTTTLIGEVMDLLDSAKAEKAIYEENVKSLEAQLKDFRDLDVKIKEAAKKYGAGLAGALDRYTTFWTAFHRSEDDYTCLLSEEKRKAVEDKRDEVIAFKERVRACIGSLTSALEKARTNLEKAKFDVTVKEAELAAGLATLDAVNAEITAWTQLVENFGCASEVSKECRYAVYLDIKGKKQPAPVDADKYANKLCQLAKALSDAKKKVRDLERTVQTLASQVGRLTTVEGDVIGRWQEIVCGAVTSGILPTLPADLDKACSHTAATAGREESERASA